MEECVEEECVEEGDGNEVWVSKFEYQEGIQKKNRSRFCKDHITTVPGRMKIV